MSRPPLRFDERYLERVTLADGLELRVRLLRPEDSHHLVDGLARMSEESRFMRFLSPRSRFDDRTLRYLCTVDGYDHFALGALALEPDGTERGAAVARFVRLEEPEVADLAITVVDELQSRGLGRLMLDRAVAAARERGIERFRCDYLKSNVKVQRLLAVLETAAVLDDAGQTRTVELVVPAPPEPASGSLLTEVLRAVGLERHRPGATRPRGQPRTQRAKL